MKFLILQKKELRDGHLFRIRIRSQKSVPKLLDASHQSLVATATFCFVTKQAQRFLFLPLEALVKAPELSTATSAM